MEKKYCFPAVLEYEDDKIVFEFPDLEEAFSFGDNMDDALQSAKEVLILTLRSRINDKEDIPEPTELKNLKLKKGQFTMLVEVTLDIKVKYVPVNTTLPEELKKAALKAKLNFSKILQRGVLEELGK